MTIRYRYPDEGLGGPFNIPDATPDNTPPQFDLDGDGEVTQDEIDQWDNNQDGDLNQEDNLNGDDIVNPFEDHLSRNESIQDNFEDLANFFNDPPSSPLVLDLDGDGIELTSLQSSSAYFDVDVNGFAEKTGWVAPDDGLLALDLDGDGVIDNGAELFGDQTGHAHGFLALAAHDDNQDGVIDAQDSVYSDLLVWQDLNGDGFSQQGEMRSLSDIGIASISVQASSTNYQVAGNEVLWESSFTWDTGETGLVVDAYFQGDQIDTIALVPDDFVMHPDVLKLPIIMGSGSLASTLVALSLDDQLRQQAIDLVTQATNGDISGFLDSFEDFVMTWGGASDVVAGSRGPNIDARHLTFLENVFDKSFSQGNPGPQAGSLLTQGMDALLDEMALVFLEQVADSYARLNRSDAMSYEQLLSQNPLTDIFNSDLETAYFAVVDGFASGDFDIEGSKLLLDMLKDRTSDPTTFEAEMRSLVENSASGDAGTVYAFYVGNVQQHITGTPDNDSLTTSSGTLFEAGEGNDSLSGSSSADVYVYRLGDGSDTIQEQGSGHDRLVFADLSINDVLFSHNSGEDLLIAVGGETVRVVDHFRNTYEDIEEIIFADGTILDASAIRAKSIADQKSTGFVRGTLYDETYFHAAGDGSYTIQETGSATDHFIFTDLNFSDVTFSHNSGEDLIMTAGSETIKVTDHFRNTYEDLEEIHFADGTILDAAAIRAKSIEDQKSAGFVRGTIHDETYFHAAGDGSYTIQETGSAADHFIFTDLNVGDVTFSHNSGEDLVMTAGSETIKVTDHFRNTYEDLEEIHFADGTILDAAAIRAKSIEDQKSTGFVRGTQYDETYFHAAGDGSYTIQETGSATDHFIFSDLNVSDVTFSHTSGEDLVMTTGSETIIVTDHFRNTYEDLEEIHFADGTILDAAAIRAKSIEDQKSTGFVRGTQYDETYFHTAGEGSYTIQETGSATDHFIFTDLNVNDVIFSQNAGEDLVMTTSTETITVTDHFRNTYEDIEQVTFADGTVLDLAGILDKVQEDDLGF